MIETMNKWYVPGWNFTPEKPIQEICDLFSGCDLQLNPQEMIDFMVKPICKNITSSVTYFLKSS